MPQKGSGQFLLDFLENQDKPPGAGKSIADQILDTLDPMKLDEVKPREMSGAELGTRFVKGLGLGVIKGLMDVPAGIGDFMWKRGITSVGVGSELALAAAQARPGVVRAIEKNREELKQGALSPETIATLRQTGELLSGTAPTGVEGFLSSRLTGAALRNAPDIVANAPDTVGQIAGAIPAAVASYGASAELAGVGLAKNLAEKTIRHLAASSAAAGAQSYLISAMDGEADWMRLVRDVGINAAFEVVGMPALRKSWMSELSHTDPKKLVNAVASATKTSPELAELKITQIRGGGGVQEPQISQAIVQAAKKDPKIQGTPIEFEAKKALAQYWDNVVPKKITVDGTLNQSHGVSFDVVVDGQVAAPGMQVVASKANPSLFADTTDKIANRIVELTQQGKSVKFENVQVQNSGAWVRFTNRLRGEQAKYGKMDARQLTDFEKKLMAAPRGSLAESGVKPEPNSKVTVSQPGRPKQVAMVDPDQSTAKAGEINVFSPVDGSKLTVPMSNAQVWIYEKRAPVKFAAHDDGTPRHLYVDLNSREAFVEGVNEHTQPDNFFRTSLFSEVDKDGDLGNGPRGFIHEDGNITLSVTRGERLTTYLDTDPVTDIGPLDVIEGGRQLQRPHEQYRTPDERVSHMMSLGSPVQERPREVSGGKIRITATDVPGETKSPFRAGFQPRRSQQSEYQGIPGRPGQFQRIEKTSHPTERITVGPGQEAETEPVTARARYPGRITEPLAEEDYTRVVSRGERIPHERYAISRGPLVDDPAIVDAQKAAKILLTQKNVDPGTKVKVVVTDSIHAGAHEHPFDWSLEDLANADFGLYSVPTVQSAAIRRGYKAIPDGEGIILRDASSDAETTFRTRLEAANFLSKQRVQELGPKIEQEAESLLQLGWHRSFDGLVDGGDFAPREAQQVALQSIVQNQRPGAKIWVKSAEYLKDLESRAEAKVPVKGQKDFVPLGKAKPGAAQVLESEIKDSTKLDKALRDLEQRLGVPKRSFKYLNLDQTQGNKSQVFIYNDWAVNRVREKYSENLKNLLKVKTGTNEQLIDGLSKREAGLDILTAPDPESAILYSYFKNSGQRDLMLSGKVIKDEASSRPYRVYDPQVKSQFLKEANAAPDAPAPPPVADFDEAMPEVELSDAVKVPQELNFDGVDVNAPPPVMETPLPHGMDPEKVHWTTGMSQWVQTRSRLFKRMERDSGIPFFSHYLNVEQAREAAVKAMAPMRKYLDSVYWKVRRRDDRTNVQLLFESIAGGKQDVEQALRAKMSDKHVKIAEELHGQWSSFLKSVGFNDNEIQASFAEFFQLRKRGGDFKAYTGARPSLPRMFSLLRGQMERANTPLTLDERETDFYSLGIRLSRMIAYEEHLTPVWNETVKTVEKQAKAVGVPQDLWGNFMGYLHEVMHTPDDAFISNARTMNVGMQKANKILQKMSGGRFSLGHIHDQSEAIDLFGALSSMGYAANLAWNPSTVVQQYLQVLQTTLPALGTKYTRKGIQFGLRWLRDPKLQEDMAQRGIAGRSSVNHPLAMLDDVIQSKGVVSNTAALAVNKFVEKGTHAFQVGDDFNRVIAYMGKHQAVMDHGFDYTTGKISWQKFREKTKLDLQDDERGPLTMMIKDLLDHKQVSNAAHRAADDFQKFSQFNYARGSGARVLDGSVGRLLGQYGTWPVSYANYLWQLASIGDKKLTLNKVKALSTMFAVNAGMLEAMRGMFNADAAKWTVWNSMRYRGGPYLELGQELAYVATAREDDPVASVYRARIKQQIGAQVIPAMAGAKRMIAASQSAIAGDWQGAARMIMGLPEAQTGPKGW